MCKKYYDWDGLIENSWFGMAIVLHLDPKLKGQC